MTTNESLEAPGVPAETPGVSRQSGLSYAASIRQTARLAHAIVRKASRDDAAAVAAIYNETIVCGGHSPITRQLDCESLEREIEAHRRLGYPAFVMTVDGEIVAYFSARSMRWASGACDHTADISIYVDSRWWGSGAALIACVHLYEAVRIKGFDKVTCWILGANTQSLAVAKAFGLEQWAHMPGVVRTMGVTSDLKIYGVSTDDLGFITRMSVMRERARTLVSRATKRLARSAGAHEVDARLAA